MEKGNTTSVDHFILIGFTVSRVLQILLFFVVYTIYIITILTNVLIIAIIRSTPSLHKPMYIFIGTFSFLELWYPSATVPKFLSNLLTGSKSISFHGCIAQCYFHFSFGATESYLLVSMAFDRYIAICYPLRYMLIMNHKRCTYLAVGSWVCGFLTFIVTLFNISRLHFCGPNKINHYYCDFAPLMMLSCTDIQTAELDFFMVVTVGLLGCLIVVLVSYVWIISAIIRMSRSTGRTKAFSTCASHLAVITLFYGTSIYMFVKPTGRRSLHTNKVVSFFPSIVTPLLNPIIYTLRNKEIMNPLRKATKGVEILKQCNCLGVTQKN
ncbi:olfactory receptor 6F1-like [Lissotriton helveticus]